MINTRNKRASAIGLAFTALSILPAPDGAVSQADRQQVAYTYAGLSAGQLIVYDFITFTGETLTPALSFSAETLTPSLSVSSESLTSALSFRDETLEPI